LPTQQPNKFENNDLDFLISEELVEDDASREVNELEYALNIKLSTLEKLLLPLDVPCGW
jgi:hypothetical protein